MKKLIAIALFLGSAHAFAMPTVGDSATYNVTITKYTNVIKFTQKVELTDYDKAATAFSLKTTIVDETGATEENVVQVPEANLNTTEILTQIVNFCEQPELGGVSKKVTVALGDIDTCQLPAQGTNKGTVNVGVVPFGVVKTDYVKTDGVHVVGEIVAAHSGPVTPVAPPTPPTKN